MNRIIILFLLCVTLSNKAQTWSAAGTFTGFPWCMATFSNEVYLGAADTLPDFPPTKIVYKLNASSWNADPAADSYYSVQNDVVRCMQVYNGQLYLGGSFATMIGTAQQYCLVQKNSNSYTKLGSGFDPGSMITSMTVWNNKLCATGTFTKAGGVSVNNIATWDGTNWSALGSGLDDDGTSVLSFNGNLYAVGNFTMAGGVPVNGIAKWNGTAWADGGMAQTGVALPFCLVEYKNELYAGGLFMPDVNTPTLSPIIKWNGTQWQNVGGGLGLSVVYAMAVHNNELYAVGNGTSSIGLQVNGIGKWDGTSWSALGSGLVGKPGLEYVMGLVSRPEGLYVCGTFTSAGGQPISNVALWSGPTSLSEIDPGVEVSLFPNPAAYKVHIQGLSNEITHAQIFDLTGRCVLECGVEKSAIDISVLPNGLYEVFLKTNGDVYYRRLVVNR